MDQETYLAIRAQWERERDDAQATLDRMVAQIRDLDRAWRRLEGAGAATPALRNGTLTSKVSAVVSGLPVEFESPAVWQAVREANPGVTDDRGFRANVANALKRLVSDGVLELLQRGQGNNPARYRRLGAAVLPEGGDDFAGL